MRNFAFIFVAAAAAFFSEPLIVRAHDPSDGDSQGRQAALRSAGTGTKIMLYPVRVLGRPNRTVANVLGLALESNGLSNVDATDAAFAAAEGALWTKIASAFGEYVAQHKPEADYALYAEYLGTPKSGPTAVRWVIVDANGRQVFSDLQTKNDRDFVRTAARDPDPLGCSALVTERLFSLTG